MLVNKDLTKESLRIYISNHQIYAKVYHKSHGKWVTDEYLKSYDFDPGYILDSTIKYIIRTWGLKNPKLSINL